MCTYIYYVTALEAYGSEAVDQHNAGDSMKTAGGFKAEEGSQDKGRHGVMKGGVIAVIMDSAELFCIFASVFVSVCY